MEKHIKKIISIIVLFLIIAFFIRYIINNLSDFKKLLTFGTSNPLLLIIISIIIIINLFLNGLLLKSLMKPFNIKLKLFEAFGLSTITNFYNLITPFRGGAGVRAIYLKKKHDFPYVHFLATLSAIYVIIFLVGSLAGLLSMLLIWLNYGIFNKLVFLVFLAFFLFLLPIIIFSPRLPESKNKWFNRFIKVINGWHLIKKNRGTIIKIIMISILQLIFNSLIVKLSYSVFNIDISLIKAMFLSTITLLSALIAITPGNLGIGDAINVFSAQIIGVGLTGAIAATILRRIINLVVIFILGPIFSYILIKHNSDKQKNKNEDK
jgi:uncharacterized protein (TIRG00374 family)